MEKRPHPIARRVIVRGRVQGVGFRWATRQQALRLGLGGSVGNAGDGSVHVEAAGSAEAVNRLIDWLRHGPPGAAVESVEVEELEAGAPGPDFAIR
jgi:acylphosphatase